MDQINQSTNDHNHNHNAIKYQKRHETREEKIKIISSLPHDTSSVSYDKKINGVNYEELNNLIKKTKEEGYSFTKELMSIKEFNNPENIKKIISHYKINEKESQYPLSKYNSELILSTYAEVAKKKIANNKSKTLFN